MIYDAEGKKISPTMFQRFRDIATEARWHWKQEQAFVQQAILPDKKDGRAHDFVSLTLFGIKCAWDNSIKPNEVVFAAPKNGELVEVGRIVNLEVS